MPDALHLRLLTEEMMGMMRSIAGDVEGKYWIEDEKDVFQLHLKVNTSMTEEKREKLIAASTSGQNEASKGFLGKLREIYEAAMSVGADVDRYYNESGSQSQAADITDTVIAEPKWDRLERSVLLSLADDVKIGIRRHLVELTVVKDFGAGEG